jgi:hypothetical protein
MAAAAASSSAAARQCAAPANLEPETADATSARLDAVKRRRFRKRLLFFSRRPSKAPSRRRRRFAVSREDERFRSNDTDIASATAKDATHAEVSDDAARSARVAASSFLFSSALFDPPMLPGNANRPPEPPPPEAARLCLPFARFAGLPSGDAGLDVVTAPPDTKSSAEEKGFGERRSFWFPAAGAAAKKTLPEASSPFAAAAASAAVAARTAGARDGLSAATRARALARAKRRVAPRPAAKPPCLPP